MKRPSFREVVVDRITHPLKKLRTETFWALKDVSFDVKKGEVLGVIGRNGAGKSTLLKVLSRIVEPTTGEADLFGRVGSLLEVGTGFHPELTGRENVFLNGAILGMRREEIRRQFDAIVAFAEVERFLDTPVKRYSSGMYVRLAFAVAAHLNPEILIVDEVLAVGDAQFQKKCIGKMGEVAKDGRTVLFVSHNTAAIQSLCTSASLFSSGRLIESGPVNEVILKYLQSTADQERQELANRVDRQGNGNLIMTEFSATAGAGGVGVMCGAPVRFEIRYRSKTSLRNVHISIGFLNPFGEGALYVSNEVAGSSFEEVPAEGSLNCCFDKLPLLPGTYAVNLYCTVNGVVADWVQQAAQVTVEDGDFFGSGKLPPKGYGSLAVPHTWEVTG